MGGLESATQAVYGVAALDTVVFDDLMALGLVVLSDRQPAMTATGRKTLIRGSFRLLYAAAWVCRPSLTGRLPLKQPVHPNPPSILW